MIALIHSVKSKGPVSIATKEIVEQLRADSHITDLHKQIADGNPQLKQQLPALMPNGYAASGSRKTENLTPTNNVMLDYDEHNDWETLWNKVKDHLEEWHIRLFEISAQGGAHMVVPQIEGKTLKETIETWGTKLGVKFDNTADLSRCMFIAPTEKILWESDLIYQPTEPEPCPWHTWTTDDIETTSDNNIKESKTTNIMDETEINPKKLTYKGIPYSTIIDRLLLRMNIYKTPEKGERNTTLYKIVRDIRYICDFDADMIFSVMPDWGLPQEEMKATIASALRSTRLNNMPKNLKEIIELLEYGEETTEDLTEPEPWENIPQELPDVVKLILSKFPESFHAPVLATLPTLFGTLATNLRAEYIDGNDHSPSLFCCVVAPQASGKSFTRTLYDLLMEPLKQQDKKFRQIEKEYRQQKSMAKNSKEMPQEPQTCIRLLPPQISNSTLLKRADLSAGKHLFIFTEELDSLHKAEKSGAWAQKSDIYRKAFDNAEFGQDYMSSESYSGVVNIYLNLLVCCTPHAKNRFFADCEDGLVSRFTFINLPDNLGERAPKFQKFTREEKQQIQLITKNLMEIKGLQEEQHWIDCPELTETIENWLEDRRMEYLQSQDHPSLDVFRRRAAVIGFRTGMIAFALEGFKWSPAVTEWAQWMAEFTLRNQMALFGDEMDKIMTSAISEKECIKRRRSGANFRLFDELPTTFTDEDIIELRHKQGKEGNIGYIISRWKKEGMCTASGCHQYTKTKDFA